MKNVLKISLLLSIMVLGNTTDIFAQAQKFGYLNSQELILLLPEAKVADKEIENYQKQLAAAFEKKVTNFQSDAAALEKKAQEGGMSQVEIQDAGAKLQQRQQALQKEEYDLTEKLGKKRNDLLKPILDKIDKAIKEVGKENGYVMIFDSSGMNVMLYHDTSKDVMPLVKAKLGL